MKIRVLTWQEMIDKGLVIGRKESSSGNVFAKGKPGFINQYDINLMGKVVEVPEGIPSLAYYVYGKKLIAKWACEVVEEDLKQDNTEKIMTEKEKLQQRIEQIRRDRELLTEEETRLCQEWEELSQPKTAPLAQVFSYPGDNNNRLLIKVTKDMLKAKEGEWLMVSQYGQKQSSSMNRKFVINKNKYEPSDITFGEVPL